MKTYSVPTRDQLSTEAQGLYDAVHKQLGFVPNLYATFGYSANMLGGYLAFQANNNKSSFNGKEREAINLAVSTVNGCEYCQAAHTAIGQKFGFTELETIQLRAGNHPDHKLDTISKLAADIQRTHGRPSQDLLKAFYGLGYAEKELMELIALVGDKVIANYVHNITQIPIDFPVAKPVAKAVV